MSGRIQRWKCRSPRKDCILRRVLTEIRIRSLGESSHGCLWRHPCIPRESTSSRNWSRTSGPLCFRPYLWNKEPQAQRWRLSSFYCQNNRWQVPLAGRQWPHRLRRQREQRGPSRPWSRRQCHLPLAGWSSGRRASTMYRQSSPLSIQAADIRKPSCVPPPALKLTP